MRKQAARWSRAALLSALVVIAGLAGAGRARAAEGTPWLGVYLQQLTDDLREGLDYRGTGGVIVSRVVAGSPADRAGVRKGDVIVRLDSRTVDSPAELQEQIGAMRVGQSAQLEVFRDGDRRMMNARLDERPSGDLGPGEGDESEGFEAPEAPEVPEAPEAPRAPRPPSTRDFVWSTPDVGDMHDLMGLANRGRLGVRIESLSPELGEYFGVRGGQGVLVLEALKGTPAERAGLRAGDVITGVDRAPVRNSSDLVDALRGKSGRVQLRVLRHRAPRTVEATLERADHGMMMFDDRGGNVRRRIVVNGKEITPGAPGTQKRIVIRRGAGGDDADLRRQIEQLRQQIDELQQRLDDEQQGDESDR